MPIADDHPAAFAPSYAVVHGVREHDHRDMGRDRRPVRHEARVELRPRRRDRLDVGVGVERGVAEAREVLHRRDHASLLEARREGVRERARGRRRARPGAAALEHERLRRRGDVGDRSEVHVHAERDRAPGPVSRPWCSASDAEPSAPICAGDIVGGAHGTCFTGPPSWSTAIRSGGRPAPAAAPEASRRSTADARPTRSSARGRGSRPPTWPSRIRPRSARVGDAAVHPHHELLADQVRRAAAALRPPSAGRPARADGRRARPAPRGLEERRSPLQATPGLRPRGPTRPAPSRSAACRDRPRPGGARPRSRRRGARSPDRRRRRPADALTSAGRPGGGRAITPQPPRASSPRRSRAPGGGFTIASGTTTTRRDRPSPRIRRAPLQGSRRGCARSGASS